jgi:hypothetical protein
MNKRNKLCSCGSGIKHKLCHGKKLSSSSSPILLGGFIALSVLVWFLIFERNTNSVDTGITSYKPLKTNERDFLDSKKPTIRPEGKIWSAEHNHWHDDPNYKKPKRQDQKENSSKILAPEGIPPEGKVWSPEHNHWHNITN